MALDAVGVEPFAREAPLLHDELRGRPLGGEVAFETGQGTRAVPLAAGAARGEERAEVHPGHGLHAAADRPVVFAGPDALGGEVHGLLAGAALAVDRGAGQADRQAGAEQRVAGHVARLLAALERAAGDQVVQGVGVGPGMADEVVERVREQVQGMPVAQGAAAAAHGGADGVDDHGVSAGRGGAHGFSFTGEVWWDGGARLRRGRRAR